MYFSWTWPDDRAIGIWFISCLYLLGKISSIFLVSHSVGH